MIDRNYSNSLQAALRLAKTMALNEQHSSYGVPHLVLALFSDSCATGLDGVLSAMGQDVDYIVDWFETHRERYVSVEGTDETQADRFVMLVLDEAERAKIKLGFEQVDAVCILTAAVRQGVVYSDAQLESLGLAEDDILNFFEAQQLDYAYQGEENKVLASVPYAYSLKTESIVEQGTMVLGREKEVRQILESLERSSHKAIMLVGGAGVGKTAIIRALAKEVCQNEDELISQTTLVALQASKLLASASNEQELTQKVSSLLHKLDGLDGSVLLVVDDLQVLLDVGATSKSSTLINILNAQISEGATRLLFTLTPDAYRMHIERHPIEHRIEKIAVEELDKLTLRSILHRHAEQMTSHYALSIEEEAIAESLSLSSRYFKEKSQPAAAIDLLDSTAASARLSNKNALNEIARFQEELTQIEASRDEPYEQDLLLLQKAIQSKISVLLLARLSMTAAVQKDEDELFPSLQRQLAELEQAATAGISSLGALDVEAIVASRTNIPIGKIQSGEKERLLGIDKRLGERVKGQEKAISTLSDAIIESRSGLSDPKKPIGSFFFLGPTGTGKTELAKSLAELLFDDEQAMIRFDMSEFKEEHSAALLYGAPPGYVGYEEGGLLVTKIRQKPYSVVLFDEIEKAHHSVYDVFLQMMDEGKIHDRLGREGDFSNAIIIFTSNIGSAWIRQQFNAGKPPRSNELIEVMADTFRPEFLGRLTEVVPFAPISEEMAQAIFKLHFTRLQRQLQEQKDIHIELGEEALIYLSAKGFSEQYGARPIAGVIRTYLKKSISRLIVEESLRSGDCVRVDYRDHDLVWTAL